MSRVTTTPAAAPHEAAEHFATRLAMETDAYDVGDAIARDRVDFVLVDVRGPDEYAAGHIRGAVNLPYGKITARTAAELPDGLVVVYCWGPGCNAAQRGALAFASAGRQVKEMLGGWEYYVREGWPVEGELAGTGFFAADDRGLASSAPAA